MKRYSFFTFFGCFLFAFQALADTVDISVDKPVITEGDTLTLSISYNGTDSEKPDLSALQEDFSIVSNYESTQISYNNGQMSQSKSWAIGLKPLKTGKITISPIKIGHLSSNYAEVEVKEMSNVAYVPDSRENSNSPYFQIEQSVTPNTPFIRQQQTVFVTIYDSIGLQGSSLSIDNETNKNWTIIPLSEKPFIKKDIIGGKSMNVITYAFAAFPLKSGEIKAPRFLFDGFYLKDVESAFPRFGNDFIDIGFDFHSAFGQKVPVRMRTNPQTIQVKAKPDNFSGLWLPLKNLTISSKWQKLPPFKTGDALSRQITVKAYGLTEDMFPSLTFPDIDGFKQYPEKPVLSTSTEDGQLVTTATVNIVYIPEKAGSFTFPKQEIGWFNVDTKTFDKTVVPAETVTVLPNTNIAGKSEETIPQKQDADKLLPEKPEKISPQESTAHILPKHAIKKFNLFYLIPVALLLILFILWHRRFKNTVSSYRKNVLESVGRKDCKAIRKALIEWAGAKFPEKNISNLDDIATIINNDDFSQQLNLLNRALYSDSKTGFNISDFVRIFKKVDKQKRTVYKDKEILPNLYD